jgi:hypothetical protein
MLSVRAEKALSRRQMQEKMDHLHEMSPVLSRSVFRSEQSEEIHLSVLMIRSALPKQ